MKKCGLKKKLYKLKERQNKKKLQIKHLQAREKKIRKAKRNDAYIDAD